MRQTENVLGSSVVRHTSLPSRYIWRYSPGINSSIKLMYLHQRKAVVLPYPDHLPFTRGVGHWPPQYRPHRVINFDEDIVMRSGLPFERGAVSLESGKHLVQPEAAAS